MRPPSFVIPALLTRMSIRRQRSTPSSIMGPTESRVLRSQTTHSALPPDERITSTAFLQGSSLCATQTTWRPSAARRSAIALPMPLLAPVTRAVRRVCSRIVWCSELSV